MQIREYLLPSGWYPRDPSEISRTISGYLKGKTPASVTKAAVAPHAGWYYSGRIAAVSVSCLDPEAQTIAVLGGHLSAGSPALFAMEDATRTPFGPMQIDNELRESLITEFDGLGVPCAEDRFRDNTVEVLLPMVRHFFPKARLLWLRLPEKKSSYEAGKIISRTAAKLNRKINVIASTDLTHYGANYGFMPQGKGAQAMRWVREVNDAAFIQAVESGDSEEVLRRAQRDSSSCSAGAVLGAMGFAKAEGLGKARLLEYATSADVNDPLQDVPDSFVGYAAMVF